MGMQSRRNIIIAGGNFAGLTLARGLCSKHFQVTVVDPGENFEWFPNIHELVSRHKSAARLRHSRRKIVERLGHRFMQAEVTGLECGQQRILTGQGQSLPFDELALCIGNVSNIDRVPGAREFAQPCSSIAEAENISRQLQRLDALNLPERPVVLVGANFVGLELLGEIVRRYRRQWRFRLHVVDALPAIMPGYRGLDAWFREQCSGLEVHWHSGRKVSAVNSANVVLDDGTILDSRLTLWCAGDMPHPLPAALGLAKPGRYIPVHASLQSLAAPRVWVAGDAADFPAALDKQAFHAIAMAGHIAANFRRAPGKPPQDYRPLPTPRLLSIGDTGLILFKSRALAHPSLLAAKEAVYQGNFNLMSLPRQTAEWYNLRDNLKEGLAGMNGMVRRAWSAGTLLHAQQFEAV